MSLYIDEDNIKLWDIHNWLCLYNIANIYNKAGILSSSCLLNFNNEYYFITGSYLETHLIKTIDNTGKIIYKRFKRMMIVIMMKNYVNIIL